MSNLDQTITKIQQIIEEHRESREKLGIIPSLLQDALQASQETPGSTTAESKPSTLSAFDKKPRKLYEAAFIVLAKEGEARVKDLAPKVSKLMKRKVEPQNVYVALEYQRKHKGGVQRDKGLWSLDKKSH